MTLDRDATMCQYLMAERFVKSLLEYRREMQKDISVFTDVIMKRLMSFDEYAKNGDRAMQQLQLLADVIACWMIEIIVEVNKTDREALKEYREERWLRMLEVNDDNETNSKTKEMKEEIKQERNNDE